MAGGPPHGNPTLPELDSGIVRLLEQMADQQRAKVLDTARKRLPNLTPEDVMNPRGSREIYLDGPFNYEDGILNGLLTAQMAVRARFRQLGD